MKPKKVNERKENHSFDYKMIQESKNKKEKREGITYSKD